MKVLVTGASGFIAMHTIVRLLKDGHEVRGTVRDLKKADRVKAALAPHADVSRLSFVAADLGSDTGWDAAVAGCTHVIHTASPVLKQPPKTPAEVIDPAKEGTLRVLRAASAAGVKRVVVTSSSNTVFVGHARDRTFDENDWSRIDAKTGAYEQSKIIAERAAWEYARTATFELVTILPGLVLGPVFDETFSVSGEAVRKLLSGEMPGVPDLWFSTVDVRDVADAHVLAMTTPAAAGQRFLVTNESVRFVDLAAILAKHYRTRGFKVPTRRLPHWLVKVVARFDKTIALIVDELGLVVDLSSARARSVLGWQTRPLEASLIDMAESMIDTGTVKARKSAA